MKKRLGGALLLLCMMAVMLTATVFAATDTEVSGGSSASGAALVQVGTSYVTTISELDTEYWYKFTTGSADGYYYLESANISVPTHSWANYMYAEICTQYGQTLIKNNHTTSTTARVSDIKLDPNTTYYVRICNSWDGSSAGYFNFKLTYKADPDEETLSEATSVSLGTEYDRTIGGTDDEDWFSFTTGSGSKYVFYGKNVAVGTHTWSGDCMFRLTLCTSTGEEVTRLQLSEGSEGTEVVGLSPNTTYYIQAKNYWVEEPYTEEGTYLFSISAPTLTSDDVTLSKTSYTYSGSARKPSVTVVWNETTLTKGTDYTVSYSNNVTVGTATVTIKGKGDYTGTVKKTFKIKAATVAKPTVTSASYSKLKIKWSKVTGASGYYVYRSTKSGSGYKLVKTITKGSTVTWTDTSRTTGKTYYYKIKAYRTTDGKKTVVATTKAGSGKTALTAPKVKLTAGTKKVTVKVSTKVSGANGYVIYRSTKKSSGYKKVKTVTSGKAFTYKNTGLKAKTTYYYKVRAYRTVSGKKVYSAYSTVVKVKTK